ncbi:glycosyl transferase [Pseudomonas gingeri]|uniref:Glycosyl transferase n=1 Tax=Pseudomonas gingeri TaxID=117681 RepID=A0A7Y7X8U9_9PSED|nr:glycosyl transferase [Pseudomonas gingeri]NWB95170.1 glycosyl transferase [Pseudomonas gingeri]
MRMIYLSPVPWASFSQRSHHFVAWYHEQTQAEILWIDPYPTRLPRQSDFKRKPAAQSAKELPPPQWLQVIKPKVLPIEPIPGSGFLQTLLWREVINKALAFAAEHPCMICVGKPSELALQLLERMPESYAIYDAMDDFPAFYKGLSRRSMAARERLLVERVSKILVSSTAIGKTLGVMTNNVELALNACDIQKLAPLESLVLDTKQQLLGYVGTIGSWFDWDLTIALAQANPDNRIQLIGPIFTPPPRPLPGNIELLPERPHAEAIAAMATFSVGLIPFKLSRLTASVDPIKYYEYRSLGLPVISTRFGEMALRDEDTAVWLIDENSDLRLTSRQALDYRCNFSRIQAFRQDNLWATRFSATRLLSDARAGAPPPPGC